MQPHEKSVNYPLIAYFFLWLCKTIHPDKHGQFTLQKRELPHLNSRVKFCRFQGKRIRAKIPIIFLSINYITIIYPFFYCFFDTNLYENSKISKYIPIKKFLFHQYYRVASVSYLPLFSLGKIARSTIEAKQKIKIF